MTFSVPGPPGRNALDPLVQTPDPQRLGVTLVLRWECVGPVADTLRSPGDHDNIFHPSRKPAQFQDASYGMLKRERIWWQDYKLSNAEHVALVQFARFEYQRKQRQKIPR